MTMCAAEDCRAAPGQALVDSIEGIFWIAFVKSGFGAEQDLAADLERGVIHPHIRAVAVVPTRRAKRVRRGISQEVPEPVFRSYVPFATNTVEERYDLEQAEYRQRQRIVTILPVPDQQRFRRQLGHTQRVLAYQPTADAWEYLLPGQRVKVRQGHPLFGVEGVLNHVDGRLQVKVDMLQRGTVADVAPEYLEPL